MANELKHASIGEALTQAEFEATNLHVINASGGESAFYQGSLSANALVVASDAPVWQKNYATMLQAMGFPVWVCDGIADDVEIQAAIDWLYNTFIADWEPLSQPGGGRIQLTEGTLKTLSEPRINSRNIDFGGCGWGTIIQPQVAMTRSFSTWTYANHVTLHDFVIDGNNLAAYAYLAGVENHIIHVYIKNHTTYEVGGIPGEAIFDRCRFQGAPVLCDAHGVAFSHCRFEGYNYFTDVSGTCLKFIGTNAANTIRNCVFQAYTDHAIDDIGSTKNAITLIGNYFESDYVVSETIHIVAARTLTLLGNYTKFDANTALSLYVESPVNLICSNDFYNGVRINAGASMVNATVYNVNSTIELSRGTGAAVYQTGLSSVEFQSGKAIIWGTAAPTTGAWSVGDKVWNTTPVNNIMYWICTVAGTLGTWISLETETSTIINDGQLEHEGDCGLYSGNIVRAGSKFDSFPISTIFKFGLWLYKAGSPTGTAYIRVRKASDDTLLGTVGTQDVSLLPYGGDNVTYYEYSTTPVKNDAVQDIRICFEFAGGDANDKPILKRQYADVKSGVQFTSYIAAWTDTEVEDLAYTIQYGSIAEDNQDRVVSGIAGTTLAYGDLIYLASADSRWELTDADTESTASALLGICLAAAAADGDDTTVLLAGIVEAGVFPTFTVGDPVYVSTYAGVISTTAPSGSGDIVRVIGHGTSTTELYFHPDSMYLKLT